MNKSRYTNFDKTIAIALLRKLPERTRQALILRFWENWPVDHIAKVLHMGWHEADQFIESALKEMRNLCLSQPMFSKSICLKLEAGAGRYEH